MKEKVKRFLATFVFQLYEKNFLKNKISVNSIEQTVDHMLTTEDSLVRFGDGEIKLISGKEIPLQKPDQRLIERLKEILQTEEQGVCIALPDIFSGLSAYTDRSRNFWMEHLLFHRKEYKQYFSNRKYENAFFSRPYIMYKNKDICFSRFEKMKHIWNGKKIVFVEGNTTHNGVGVDLFETAASIERIICPSSQAWEKYEEILAVCKKQSPDRLILISLGTAGKVLAVDLHRLGYRSIDIGNLDMEYEWFLGGDIEKRRLLKHEICNRQENEAAGYFDYLQQIIAIIH